MKKKMYWGIASLILIIGVACVYFMLQPETEPEPETRYIVPSEADLKRARETRKPPREAKDGFTWEWHTDHWHEVPIAQNETSTVQPMQVKQHEKPEFTGPLTYHKELLESNPVEALRLQAEERGHWSAEWIPPFPPDDHEAAAIARDLYHIIYYKSIRDTTNPKYQNANRKTSARVHTYFDRRKEISSHLSVIPIEDMTGAAEELEQFKLELARMSDLARLGWTLTDEEDLGTNFNLTEFASETLFTK